MHYLNIVDQFASSVDQQSLLWQTRLNSSTKFVNNTVGKDIAIT